MYYNNDGKANKRPAEKWAAVVVWKKEKRPAAPDVLVSLLPLDVVLFPSMTVPLDADNVSFEEADNDEKLVILQNKHIHYKSV